METFDFTLRVSIPASSVEGAEQQAKHLAAGLGDSEELAVSVAPRDLASLYAELAAHPDFVVGGFLSRDHLSEAGIDPDLLDRDGIMDTMNSAANDELWSIVREQADLT
jgi:hypothetical protein